MCGTHGRRADKQRIAEWMQTHNTSVFDDSSFEPNYNVAPQTMQPVVRLDSGTSEREFTVMRWGLVPFWSKDGKAGYNTINARAEIITTGSLLQWTIDLQYETGCSQRLFGGFAWSDEHIALLRFEACRFVIGIDEFC
jgi:hypothetical protein